MGDKWILIAMAVLLAADVAALIRTAAALKGQGCGEECREENCDDCDECRRMESGRLLPGSTIRCRDLDDMCSIRYVFLEHGVETVWDAEDIAKGRYVLYVTAVDGKGDGEEMDGAAGVQAAADGKEDHVSDKDGDQKTDAKEL